MNWENMDIEEAQDELLKMKYVLNHYLLDLSMLAELFNYEFEDIDEKTDDILNHINQIMRVMDKKL